MRRPRFVPPVACAVVVCLTATAWSAAAAADNARTAARAERIAELHEQLGEVSEQEGALLREIADIRKRLGEFNTEVRRVERELANARWRLNRAERALVRAEAERVEIAEQLAEAAVAVEVARRAMNVTVNALYLRGQTDKQAVYAAIVEASQSPHQVLTASRYLKGVLLEDRATFDRFLALKDHVEGLHREAEQRRNEAVAARDAMAVERDRLDGLRNEAVTARDAARAEARREEELLAEVQARKADFQRELRLLQEVSSAIGAWLRSLQAGQRLAPRQKGTFGMPVNAPMSSRFGPRVHPIYGDTRVHTGVDFSVGSGVPIRAGGPGVVVWSGPRGGYGNLVIIDHENGLATLYAHQSRLDASVGQRVEAGEVVGAVGSTGMSTGPHLHFETRELGTPVDPLYYL